MNRSFCDPLRTIGRQIKSAEATYQRQANSVQLLAVSKHHPVAAIEAAYKCGQRAFGENYAQELHAKAVRLRQADIEWHFIGPIQSNKTPLIANIAHWVHSIDRYKIARRLSEQKPANKAAINLCIQINISAEASKSGVNTEQLPALAEQIQELEGIRLRGLMAIPAPTSQVQQQREAFARVRQAMEALNQQGYNLDTLSMGMSQDMEAAIAEGATIVRIGTAIFGQRPAT